MKDMCGEQARESWKKISFHGGGYSDGPSSQHAWAGGRQSKY